jgi:hypothetical protein
MKDVEGLYQEIFATISEGSEKVLGRKLENMQAMCDSFKQDKNLQKTSVGAEAIAMLASMHDVLLDVSTAEGLSDHVKHVMFTLLVKSLIVGDPLTAHAVFADIQNDGFSHSALFEVATDSIAAGMTVDMNDEQSVNAFFAGSLLGIFGDNSPLLIGDTYWLNELFLFSMIVDRIMGSKAVFASSMANMVLAQKIFTKNIVVFLNDYLTDVTEEERQKMFTCFFGEK